MFGTQLKPYIIDFPAGGLKGQLMTVTPIGEEVGMSGWNHPHMHSFYEMHYVTHGTCGINVNSKEYILSAGQLILIPPDVYHAINIRSQVLRRMCVALHFPQVEGNAAQGFAKALYNAFSKASVTVIKNISREEPVGDILHQMNEMVVSGQDVGPVARERLKCLTALLTVNLAERLGLEGTEEFGNSGISDAERKFIIDEFFNQNYGLHDGSAQLASLLCVSERHMNRVLLNFYGMNFRDKLRETKKQISYYLLTASNFSIGEIAENLGYESPANFATFIKKSFGKTPSQLRNAKKEQEAKV